MSEKASPRLSAEQWEARDYRQPANELDSWAKGHSGKSEEADATEYVAKLGLDQSGSVIVMNRAHDRVLVPPPARAVLAAFALLEQSFGFTPADVDLLERVATGWRDEADAAALRSLRGRLEALLPPRASA